MANFAYALRTDVHDSTDKTLAELFLGRKLLTPFERMTFTENQLSAREKADLNKIIAEAQKAVEKAQERQAKYYNVKMQEFKVNLGDLVLVESHILSNIANNVVAKFAPKYESPFKVVETVGANLRILKDEKNSCCKY